MSLIKKPHEIEIVPIIKVLIYGQPGIGKSTLALSAPNPLLLDFDGGVHRVKSQHQSDTVQVRSWKDVDAVLREDLSNYKTLVIDTAGKLLDFLALQIVADDPKMGKKDGVLSLQGYGVRKNRFSNFVKQVSILGKNLVFVAHDKEEKNGDDKIIRPEIGGSSLGDLTKEIDLMGYMEAIGKKRTISFDPCERYYGKNTCDLPSVMEVPDLSAVGNDYLTQLFEQYKESLKTRRAIFADYQVLIDVIKDGIEEIENIEMLNERTPEIIGMQHLLDSKLQAGLMLNAKAKALGAKYNAKTKAYEAV